MPSPIGDFDVVLQVTTAAIQKLLNAGHASGLYRHLVTAGDRDRFSTILLGPQALALDPQTGSGGQSHASVSGRVIYYSRPSADAKDHGYSAVADVTARVTVGLTTGGDPAPLTGAALAVDWTRTTASDITVHTGAGGNNAPASEVVNTLLDAIAKNTSWTYPLPPLVYGADMLGSASIGFTQAGNSYAVTVGLNAGNVIKGSRSQLQTIFAAQEWAAAVGSGYLGNLFVSEFAAQLGELPAPHGKAKPKIADGSVCLIPNPAPLGPKCLLSARQQVLLDSLDWSFQEGSILLTGQFEQHLDGVFAGSAAFQLSLFASLDAAGSVALTFSQPQIQLQQWYAQALNFLSSGAITRAITKAMTGALRAISDATGGGLFSAASINSLASLGYAVQMPLAVTPQSIAIHSYGVVLQGSLSAGPETSAPVAMFQVLPSSDGPATLILNAQNSWSPGQFPAAWSWDFGDGTSDISTGIAEHFVTSHRWSPGTYRVCLTLTDPLGNSTQTCQTVSPGLLTVNRVNVKPKYEGTWVVCQAAGPQTLTFSILSNGMPVSGAAMSLSAGAWQVTQVSGPDGIVTFAGVDQAHFTVPNSTTDGFIVGGVNAGVSMNGFPTVTSVLWLYNCAGASLASSSLQNILNSARQLPQEILNPLGPVMGIGTGEWSGLPIDGGDPWSSLARDTVLASNTLLHMTEMAMRSSDTRHVATMLGIAGHGQELHAQIRMRLESLLRTTKAELSERATALGGKSR